jgi:hypothetical protein
MKWMREAPPPAHHASAREQPTGRSHRDGVVGIRFQRVEHVLSVQRSSQPRRSRIQQVIPTHMRAGLVSADYKRVQILNNRRRRTRPSRRQIVRNALEDLRFSCADAYAHTMAAESDASRPPEAVNRLQSARRVFQPGRHGTCVAEELDAPRSEDRFTWCRPGGTKISSGERLAYTRRRAAVKAAHGRSRFLPSLNDQFGIGSARHIYAGDGGKQFLKASG